MRLRAGAPLPGLVAVTPADVLAGKVCGNLCAKPAPIVASQQTATSRPNRSGVTQQKSDHERRNAGTNYKADLPNVHPSLITSFPLCLPPQPVQRDAELSRAVVDGPLTPLQALGDHGGASSIFC
jgi:hypothetical protein